MKYKKPATISEPQNWNLVYSVPSQWVPVIPLVTKVFLPDKSQPESIDFGNALFLRLNWNALDSSIRCPINNV